MRSRSKPAPSRLNPDAVLAELRSTFRSWERDPSPLLGMDEENLRSVLVGSLNGSFAGLASAETYNRRGKTDILIRDSDRNVLIGECKIYNGPAGLVDAIGQLAVPFLLPRRTPMLPDRDGCNEQAK